MHALEGTESWFKDHVSIPVVGGTAVAFLDPDFLACCAPRSIFAQHAVIQNYTGLIGAEVGQSTGRTWVAARCQPPPPDGTLITLTVAGLHRDFADKRLALCTREQFENNRAFYAAAHRASPA